MYLIEGQEEDEPVAVAEGDGAEAAAYGAVGSGQGEPEGETPAVDWSLSRVLAVAAHVQLTTGELGMVSSGGGDEGGGTADR